METRTSNKNDTSFYKDVISKLGAVVFIVDLESLEYIWGNDRYYDLFGYREDEIIRNIMEFAENYFHPDDKSIVKERVDAFRDNKINSWSGVYRIKHKKGHWVWVHAHFVVRKRDTNGKPVQLLGVVIDAGDNFKTIIQAKELLLDRFRKQSNNEISKLTAREVEIMYLIASGKNYTEIAEILSIQPDTVNKHRKNILKKLELHNIASLVSFAKESGLA